MNKQKTLIFSLSAMLFIALAFIVYSWTEPTEMPSSYSAPINTGTDRQYKFGEIGATRFLDTDGDYYINPSGISAVKGAISITDPPLENQHAATKGYVDDLFGNIVEQEEVSFSNLIYVTGNNPSCPRNSIEIMRHLLSKTCGYHHSGCRPALTECTTAGDVWTTVGHAPSCEYITTNSICADQYRAVCVADSWDAIICAKAGVPLWKENHTEEQCEAWNGEVVTVESDNKKICRFNSGTCPSSWTQYENWSTTVPSPSAFYDDPIERISYYTGSHNWSNTPVESFRCKKCVGLASWKGYYFCGTTDNCGGDWYYSYATITQIGCY